MTRFEDEWAAPQRTPPASALTSVPLVSIALIVLLTTAILWIADRAASERQRTTTISDAMWVDQTLRFQLSVHEDMLLRNAHDARGTVEAREAAIGRARVHIASNPEVLRIAWYDANGREYLSVPSRAQGETPPRLNRPEAGGRAPVRPVYTLVRGGPEGAPTVGIAVRAVDGSGTIVATVSIGDLLQRQIPRWIGQSYAVRILDAGGAILAEKARADPAPGAYGHVLPFDPPLPGIRIAVAPLHGGNPAWDYLLPIGIVSASVLAVLSLALLHRQSAERKQAEARLAAEVAFRHSMEDSLTVGLRAKDHDGAVLYVNPAFCDLVGYAASELVGTRPPMPYWLEDLHAETLRRQALLGNGLPRPQSFETRFRRRDGRIIDVQVYEAPLIDGQGRHRGWMGSFIDISESKRASELARIQSQTLQRTGRLVTMGEMASTLAHELNQPLSAIASYATGSLNLLGREDVDPAVLRPALERLAQQADRAGQVIRRIQDFTRKRDPRFRPVALAGVVSDSLAILAPDARTHGIRLLTRMAEGLPEVAADPILLEQVLINLVRNAIEAMAANPDRATSDLTVTLDGTMDEQVIEVVDAGTGIDPAIAERLFDPFTSTKPEGMGIGLNICRSIVELHNGRLRHRPNPAGGTIFTVALPVRAMEETETP